MRKVDVIVTGLGFAGAALALQLLERRKTLAVFDVPENNRSSSVAAGLFNPVTGKMMAKAWKADILFPYLRQFYSDAEHLTGENFFYPVPVYIPFVSVEEQNNWMVRSAGRSMQDYVGDIFTKGQFGGQIREEYGGVVLKQCGYVDSRAYLAAVRNLLLSNGSYFNGMLNAGEVMIESEVVRYNDFEAKSIVFCDGMGTRSNRFFSWLPILPLKGETLDIALSEKPLCIYNRGVYLVPSEPGVYKAGSTYDRTDVPGVTETGKTELVTKLGQLVRMPYQILRHDWGIRPSTYDRRPMIGQHPRYPNVLVFNGMGTKGISQAPYFAAHLADHLLHGGQIEKEVNISRFYTLYSKFRD